jgi:hypothetical protein
MTAEMMTQSGHDIMARVWKVIAGIVVGCLLATVSVGAQEPVVVTGRVVTGPSDAAVSGALVAAGDARVVADGDGRFTVLLLPGARRLVVTAEGFLDEAVELEVAGGMPSVVVKLAVRPPVRESVTVSADREAEQTTSTVTVEPVAVLRVAGAADNIFKALHTLPGVSATDDFGSRLSVRGGGPDQNLTVMDGVEIHNPYRLFGLTSAFNPETVQRFELTAGGFGVEYGDRLSSILVVENRAGEPGERLAGSAALSLTDMNIVFEGKLPGRSNGSWLFTGRRTYYDLVADKITGTDLPSFGDLQTKVDWDIKPGHSVRVFGLRSREKTDAEFTDAGDRIAVGDTSTNDLVSFGYRGLFGPSVLARTTLAWYDYGDDLGVDGSVKDGARRSNVPTPDGETRASIVFNRGLRVRDLSLRQQVDVQLGRRHSISTGLDVHALRTAWNWTIVGDRNSSAANGSAVIGGAGLPSLLSSSRRSTRAAAWLADRFAFNPRFRIEPGVRVDWSGVNGEAIASPRISASFEIAPGTRLRGAFGRFTQSPGYEKMLQSDYFVDLTPETAANLSSERAIHTLAAFERDLGSTITIRVEGYSKRFSRLIVGRLETPEETAARVGRYAFPLNLQDQVPRSPTITSVPSNGAAGHAYGFDLYVEKRQRSAEDRLSGWASYTWGRANQDAYGVTRPFDYDRRHAVSVVSSYSLFRRLDLGATLRVASGFPTTRPVGVRVGSTDAPDGSGRLVPATDASGNLVWAVDFGDVSNLARGHLPVYARLDFRATFKPSSPTGRWQLYVDVLNLLNRTNTSVLDPFLEFDPSSDRPSIGYGGDGDGLPLLPSFGLRYRF